MRACASIYLNLVYLDTHHIEDLRSVDVSPGTLRSLLEEGGGVAWQAENISFPGRNSLALNKLSHKLYGKLWEDCLLLRFFNKTL
jgi:hypothetical protein